MAGGLQVLDMIKTLRNNKNLRTNNYFKKDHSLPNHHTKNLEGNMPVASAQEREAITLKVIESRKKEIYKNLWVLGISILVAAIIILLLLWLI